ncbi:hypothetical protein QVD99_8737 [Batrachochytrium dendrobatidis]|nr:hypothetical protein QVD99_8737 [Batrachochytrium dendrobatidis]
MATKDSQSWRLAADLEMNALHKNQTWIECQLPSGRKPIQVKWVFRIKRNSDGTIDKYKARLVAKGFVQIPGIDYNETYAPVLRFTSFRTLLTLAAILDLEIDHTDANNAFLNGVITEDLYIELPEGYNNNINKDSGRTVGKLQKALYGLKQSPHKWNEILVQECTNLGFIQCISDPCIMIKRDQHLFVMIAIYVDDILFVGNNRPYLDEAKKDLFKVFSMKDLGPIHTCLNIRVIRDRQNKRISVSQEHYLKEVLTRFNMTDCKPACTPFDPGIVLTPALETENTTDAPYREAVGSLMYAMVATRPDLGAAIGLVSRYLHKSNDSHWTAVKRILRYVKHSISYSLVLGGDSPTLTGYCDADWAGDVDSRKSTSGYAFFIGNGCISWRSTKQTSVAVSTMEAEYIAAATATRELLFLRTLLKELGFEQLNPTILYSDSQSAIANTKNLAPNHAATKHMDVKLKFLRDQVTNKTVSVEYVKTNDQVADILTKGLPRFAFDKLSDLLGLYPVQGVVGCWNIQTDTLKR